MNALSISTARANSGFTLIELMVAVVIIGILSAIAVPIYKNYVLSGDITEATNTLSSLRAQMEQYYQDNRTYLDVTSGTSTINSPCDSSSLTTLNKGLKYFTITCPSTTASSYTLVATGNSGKLTAGFVFNLDNYNSQSSTMGAIWGGTVCSSTWKTSSTGSC